MRWLFLNFGLTLLSEHLGTQFIFGTSYLSHKISFYIRRCRSKKCHCEYIFAFYVPCSTHTTHDGEARKSETLWAGHTSLSSPILHALTSRGGFQSIAPSRGEMRVKWSQLDITCFLIFKNKKHFPEAATVMLARWLLVGRGRGVTLGLRKHITLWHRLWLLKAHTQITKATTFSQRHWHSDPP